MSWPKQDVSKFLQRPSLACISQELDILAQLETKIEFHVKNLMFGCLV